MIPEYITQLPEAVQKGWIKVFEVALQEYDTDKATLIANQWVSNRFVKTNEGFVANSEDFVGVEYFSFNLDAVDTEIVVNSEDGDIVISAVLSSLDPWFNVKDNNYSTYTEECLKDFESQINTEGLTLPDIEHKEYDEIMKYANSPEEVVTAIKKRKGLLKNINAKYTEGKLYIQAKLDKRYKNYADMYKSISLEAMAKKSGSTYTGGKILGFTFTNNPANKSAKVLSVN